MSKVKLVRVRHTFDLLEEVPVEWDDDMVKFNFTDSTRCASNTVAALHRLYESEDVCPCDVHGVAEVETVDPTPRDRSAYGTWRLP